MSKLIADKSKAGINYEEIPRVIVINFLKHGLRTEKGRRFERARRMA